MGEDGAAKDVTEVEPSAPPEEIKDEESVAPPKANEEEREVEEEEIGEEEEKRGDRNDESEAATREGDSGSKKQQQQGPLVCHGHSRPIVDIQYSPITKDGTFLVSASKDGKPMLRNGTTGDWIGTFEGHKGAVWSACLNQPATLAATGSADFSAKVWDALTGDQVYEFSHKHIVRCVSFSPNSSKLVTGGFEKILRIYDLTKPENDPVVLPQQKSAFKCAKWSTSNDNLIYTTLADESGLLLWDLRTNDVVQRWETSSIVTSIELSSNSEVVTTASGNQVAFFKAETGDKLKEHAIPFVVESASLCKERNCFAAGGEDMWVHLYDYETGEEIDCNKGHHGPVHCVRFAPDGKSYSSGSEDGTIRIWRTPTPKTAAEEGKEEVNGKEEGEGEEKEKEDEK